MLLPYEYELTCISCCYNVNKQKNDFSKIQRKKKTNFTNRLKSAEHKIFCISIDVKKIYEGEEDRKKHWNLYNLKNEKNEN